MGHSKKRPYNISFQVISTATVSHCALYRIFRFLLNCVVLLFATQTLEIRSDILLNPWTTGTDLTLLYVLNLLQSLIP